MYGRFLRGAVVVAVVVVGGGAAVRAAEMAVFNKARESISAKDLKQHIHVLASDTFEGRESGSRGGKAAGIYLGQQFRKLKLQGVGTAASPDYFQEFGYEC